MALSFHGSEEVPHFESRGFRIKGKRMFTTYLAANHTANVFLSPAEQEVFCRLDTKIA